tara:strand:- start:1423 stop:1560 length:138 start_codon:yes stop_codon:yes gene_type:complete
MKERVSNKLRKIFEYKKLKNQTIKGIKNNGEINPIKNPNIIFSFI